MPIIGCMSITPQAISTHITAPLLHGDVNPDLVVQFQNWSTTLVLGDLGTPSVSAAYMWTRPCPLFPCSTPRNKTHSLFLLSSKQSTFSPRKMSANAEQPLQLPSIGIGPALVILSQSFALFAYKRALSPLYSSVPAGSYISYATIVSSVLGSIVELPTSVAALTYGLLLAAAPNTVFYVGKYTAKWRDPALGPVVTHALVLVPILVSGVALLQGANVRAR